MVSQNPATPFSTSRELTRLNKEGARKRFSRSRQADGRVTVMVPPDPVKPFVFARIALCRRLSSSSCRRSPLSPSSPPPRIEPGVRNFDGDKSILDSVLHCILSQRERKKKKKNEVPSVLKWRRLRSNDAFIEFSNSVWIDPTLKKLTQPFMLDRYLKERYFSVISFYVPKHLHMLQRIVYLHRCDSLTVSVVAVPSDGPGHLLRLPASLSSTPSSQPPLSTAALMGRRELSGLGCACRWTL